MPTYIFPSMVIVLGIVVICIILLLPSKPSPSSPRVQIVNDSSKTHNLSIRYKKGDQTITLEPNESIYVHLPLSTTLRSDQFRKEYVHTSKNVKRVLLSKDDISTNGTPFTLLVNDASFPVIFFLSPSTEGTLVPPSSTARGPTFEASQKWFVTTTYSPRKLAKMNIENNHVRKLRFNGAELKAS